MSAAVNHEQIMSALDWMARKGTSVYLGWCEDDGCWECSWITGGKRYTAHKSDILAAIGACLEKAGVFSLTRVLQEESAAS